MLLGIFNGFLDPVYIGEVNIYMMPFNIETVALDVIPGMGIPNVSVSLGSIGPIKFMNTTEPTQAKHIIIVDGNTTYNFQAIIEHMEEGRKTIDLALCGDVRIMIQGEDGSIQVAGPETTDIEIGQHYWALSADKLVVVLRVSDGYEVCGAWECGISAEDLTIISCIDRPDGHDETKLYYL